MNISVLGCGRWGTCIAWYLHTSGHNVTLWGPNDGFFENLCKTRKNPYMELPETMVLNGDLRENLNRSEVIVISIPAQQLRSFAQELAALEPVGKTFILCMKGLEKGTGERLSLVAGQYLGEKNRIAVWVGPGHVQCFTRGIPSCMVIDCADHEVTRWLVDTLTGDLIRFYYGQDIIGTEVGAASKNVMGLAAGMLDGAGWTALKGALMARGIREISRLVKAMGGQELTPYGLSHLGDYEATLFSPYSHNRAFGELFIQGKPFESLAEGVDTTYALMDLAKKYNTELPVTGAIRQILDNGGASHARTALDQLFSREIKTEF